jgi:hypothetical protein
LLACSGIPVSICARGSNRAAAARVLAFAAGKEGELDDRLKALPERDFMQALLALYEAGWVYDSVDRSQP